MVSGTLTRRQVLRGVAAGIGLLVASSALPLLHGLGGRRVASATELTHATFAGVVGTGFRVEVSRSWSPTIHLLSVRSLIAQAVPPPTGEGFSLLFAGVLTERFPQATYTVDHSTLGRFDMFLVPVGPAGQDQRYEAVFNRLWK